MTIEELANQAGVKVKQVKKRYKEIPGVTKNEDGSFTILDGTRYPARKPNRIETMHKKLRAMLLAIDKYKYIDAQALRISNNSLQLIINFALEKQWIQENGSENPYGTNKYDITFEGDRILSKRFSKREIEEISAAIGTGVGHLRHRYVRKPGYYKQRISTMLIENELVEISNCTVLTLRRLPPGSRRVFCRIRVQNAL